MEEKKNGYTRTVVYRDNVLEIVKIVWGPGTVSPAHDHGNSYGRIWILKGEIYQKVYSKPRKEFLYWMSYSVGEEIQETPDTIHIMGNLSSIAFAETLHVYMPPLQMTEYDLPR